MNTRAQLHGTNLSGMSMLANQLNSYSQLFKQVADLQIVAINEMQRDANREFTPVIAARMEPAYEACTNENGASYSPGSRPPVEDQG
jgi:hypothetical protein